jgi:hypothetical protein
LTFCCREQISDVYGDDSNEMDSFEVIIEKLSIDDDINYVVVD